MDSDVTFIHEGNLLFDSGRISSEAFSTGVSGYLPTSDIFAFGINNDNRLTSLNGITIRFLESEVTVPELGGASHFTQLSGGDPFLISDSANLGFRFSDNYESGDFLSGSTTFLNTNLAAFDFEIGDIYTWEIPESQSVTLSVSAVPEPSTVIGTATALIGLIYFGRKRSKKEA